VVGARLLWSNGLRSFSDIYSILHRSEAGRRCRTANAPGVKPDGAAANPPNHRQQGAVAVAAAESRSSISAGQHCRLQFDGCRRRSDRYADAGGRRHPYRRTPVFFGPVNISGKSSRSSLIGRLIADGNASRTGPVDGGFEVRQALHVIEKLCNPTPMA